MPALKRNKALLTVVTLFVLLLSVIAPLQAIDIYSARLYTENDMYHLDAEFDIRLSEETQRAVRHGITVKIVIRFQLYQERDWLWDKKLNETALEYQLEHQPLTENYLTVDLKKGLRRSYKSLNSALDAIGSVSAITLFNSNVLKPELKYNARIKSFIDLESLPTPMRPQAYFSANWNTSSKWHQWEVMQ